MWVGGKRKAQRQGCTWTEGETREMDTKIESGKLETGREGDRPFLGFLTAVGS